MKAIKMHLVKHGRHPKVVVPEKSQLCMPSAKIDFTKINTRTKGSGGYKRLTAAEAGIDLNTSDNSYNDYIHFNYGSVEERYYGAAGN
jgi:hypothetical protein